MLSFNKRVGLVVMVVSVVASVIAFLISGSNCPLCNYNDVSMLKLVMDVFTIHLSEDVAIPTKYFLFFFLSTFGTGLLFYLEALDLRSWLAPSAETENIENK
jgi:hypothetical protein